MTNEDFSRQITDMIETLYRVSCSMLTQPCDREDAVQEALQKAWRKRDSLRDERYLRTWVIRILINECRNVYARGRRETTLDTLPERAQPEAGDRSLREALMCLDAKLRLPIVLHYIEGYSVEEIARMLRRPSGTIKSRMAKARKLLKEMLEASE